MTIRRLWILVALGAVVGVPSEALAQAGRAEVEEGNRLYSEGRFDEAYRKYLEALLDAPDSPLIRFNEGNALFQSQDLERAMEAYRAAIESGDPGLRSAAWYNVGNALFGAQQLEEALEAYKQALRVNPSDIDAKHNLERVLEQMQQQDQNQDRQDGDPNEDQEQDRNQDPEQTPDGGENPPEDSEGQQPPPDSEDPGERPPPDQGEDPGESEPEESEGDSPPEPGEGEMTPEEAERLLQAVREDPDEVNRKGLPARGRIPRKKW